MADAPTTCREGLAQHAPLPARLSELLTALADMLQVHMTALDPADEHSKPELDAYLNLSVQFQAIAAGLQKVSGEMASYRDLPMGRHDPHVMSSAMVFGAFRQYVRTEQALMELLQRSVEQDQQMLAEMG